MTIYVYPKCSTCQKAMRFLEGKKVVVKDIVKEPPSIKELETMLQYQESKITKIMNTSGQLYREMGLSQKIEELGMKGVLKLLSQNGMLVKRPFLLGDGFGLVGFKEEEWQKKI